MKTTSKMAVSMQSEQEKKASYREYFWLFMIGNVLGVLLEGVWCLATKGRWETHTVSIWGPFCLIYGVGLVGIYFAYKRLKDKGLFAQFLTVAVVADVVEYACSVLLDYALGMKAWDYSEALLNVNGRIALFMTLIWGCGGLVFIRFCAPNIEKYFSQNTFALEKPLCVLLSIFMALNIFATTLCIVRWSDRHFGYTSKSCVAALIDEIYPDERMQKIFVEWAFLCNV